jgi:hypothetical protein
LGALNLGREDRFLAGIGIEEHSFVRQKAGNAIQAPKGQNGIGVDLIESFKVQWRDGREGVGDIGPNLLSTHGGQLISAGISFIISHLYFFNDR